MLDRFKLSVLLQGLTLALLTPTSRGSSLGLTVQVVPLYTGGGETVRAHFSVIVPAPCPDFSSVCTAGEDCQAYLTSLPFNYTKPSPPWCLRQWQKTVPSNYSALLSLGSTQFFVSINAEPVIRANNGKLNQPASVALPPPLRARQNCPVDFDLSVKDLNGDRVRCRFAQADRGECLNCTQQAFIKLDEEKCILSYTGNAVPGQYFIFLMAEDLIPVPTISQVLDITPLSSVPVHLSLSVEEWTSSCSNAPVATEGTPKQNSVLFVLPYQEVKFSTNYDSELESVLEIAVVGPPDLYRVGFASVGHLATLTMAWIRSENNLTRLLPICFVANTNSLQSELQCVWLFQKETRTLPAGTELTCGKTEMTLVLPVASLVDINLAELQLNSPTCPVTYNSTYLTAHIALNDCGTNTVHAGSDLVYTNTLKTMRPYTMISRKPSLIFPVACRIPAVQVKGPQYNISMPTEREIFGEFTVWLEFYLPGEGPLANFTAIPTFRSNNLLPGRARRDVGVETRSNTITGSIGSRIKQLDLYVLSNCSIKQAEMVVSNCIRSETEDFSNSQPILKQGCITSNNTLEVVTTDTNSRVYQLDLETMVPTSYSTMYVECTVNLCIATMPSFKCPDLCTQTTSSSPLVGSVFTSTYTVRSGPVSLFFTTPAPISTTPNNNQTTTSTPTTTLNSVGSTQTPTPTSTISTSIGAGVTSTMNTTTSHAPDLATSRMAGVILTTVYMFLWMNILH